MTGVELATAYVSLVADTSKLPKQVGSAFKDVQKQADGAGQGVGSALSSGITKTLTVGVASAGLAAGGVMAAAMVKGMGRLTAIDSAQGKLRGLGHDAQSVGTIMDSALASVKGTAYGLGEAATVAASAVAAGIKPGKELTEYLSLTGDAASIAGMEMSEMGGIFNKVAASGKIQGDVIAQLSDAGIPIVQMLGQELGKTAEEVYKLASDGKINFETFQAAMEEGLGGAALESGDTVVGAFKNMQAALGRVGANALGPGFERLPKMLGGITDALDETGKSVGPFAKALDDLIFDKLLPENFNPGGALADFTSGMLVNATAGVNKLGVFIDTELPVIAGKARSIVKSFFETDQVQDSIDSVVGVFWTLVGAAKAAGPPLLQIGKSLAEASGALGVSSWKLLLTVLEATATVADAVLVPALQATANFMRDNKVVVIGLAAAFAMFKTVPMIVGAVSAATGAMGARMATAGMSMAGMRAGVSAFSTDMRRLTPQIGVYGAAMRSLGNSSHTINRMQNAFIGASSASRGFWDATKIAGSGALSGMRAGISGVASALGGPMNIALMAGAGLLISWASGVQKSKANLKAYQGTLLDVAKSQNDVTSQLLASGGNVDDTVMSKLASQVDNVKEGFESLGKEDAKWYNVTSDVIGDINPFTAGRGSGDDISKEMDRVAQSNKDAAAAIDRAELSSEQYAKLLNGSRGDFDVFVEQMRAQGEGAGMAADKLVELRTNLDQSKEVARRVTPGFIDISNQFKTMADNFASADSKGDALYRTLLLIAGIDPDLKTATDSVNKHVRELKGRDVADPSLGSGAELFDPATGLVSTVTENGQTLSDDIATAIQGAADLAYTGADVNTIFGNLQTEIEQTARVFGVEVPKMREAFEKNGLNDEVIRISSSLSNASSAAKDFSQIWGGMKALEGKGEQRVLTAPPEIATKEVRDKIQEEWKGIVNPVEKDGKVIAFDIDLRDDEAWRKANEWVNWQAQVAQFKTDAKLGLDVTSFDTKSAEAQGVLQRLNELEAKPGADLDISKLLGQKEISVEELTRLQDKVTNPQVLLDITRLLSQAVIAGQTLDGVANTPRTAYINVQANIATAQAAISGTIAMMSAQQGIPVTPRANGGIDRLPGQAKIQPGSGAGLVQWAEGETGGEAFIPLAASKRGRSTSILADVASRFGYKLTAFAEGGINGIQAALNAGRSNNGVKYLWGGTGPNGWDCSGWVGWLQQIAMGIVGSTKRLYTTYSLLDGSLAGLQRGLGPAGTQFQVGVSQEHMAATIGGQTAESGGAHGTSRIGSPAVGATDGQFTNWFHLPNSMIAGGVANSFTPGDRRTAEWTEDDDLDLQDAQISVRQEQDRRNEVQEKFNKGEATQAELDKAELDVKKSQKKVLDLQKQKDAAGAGKYVAPEAPGIAKMYSEQEMERLDAQMAVNDAKLKRNETYDDPEASEDDRLRADMAVIRAQNSLAEAIKGAKDGKDYSARGIAKTFLDRASDAALDGVFGQIPFGVGDSRWVTTDWNSLIPEGDWTQEQVDSQLGVTPGQGDWMSALSKNLEGAPAEVGDLLKRVKVFDNGGWLEPGDIGINLSSRPEPIFNSPDQLRQFAGGLNPAQQQRQTVDASVHFHAPVTTADINEFKDTIRAEQQWRTRGLVRR